MLLLVTLIPLNSRGAFQEYEVKAAYLYHFAKYVTWPASSEPKTGNTFIICILGENTFADKLDSIAGKQINGQPIEIRYRRHLREEEIKLFQVLFICRSEESQLVEIINKSAGMPVLLVSDIGQFAERGGMIEMILEDGKVRFHINRTAANSSHLTISSQLLKLARKLF